MQNTSGITNYSTLIAGNYTVETKVNINGVDYGEDVLISVETTGSLFKDDLPVIGSCVSGEIDIRMLMPSATIPRMATIKPYIRLSNIAGTVKSGWLQKGEYFIDTRSVTNNDDGINILKIHGYDAMLKAEATYPDDNQTYPKSDTYVVNLIATTMGIQIDSRTTALMDESYQIVHPAFASMRQVLMNIAGMYAGNFIISPEGKLLLVQLGSVGDGSGTPDHQIGKNASQMTVAPAFDGFSKVIIRTGEYDSDGNEIVYESGNTTGRTLECEIDWGSQTVADNILSVISGWSYQPYEASGVVINPALELGDSISINGVYSGIYTDTIKFAQLFTADTKAPYDEEIDHEYAYEDPREKKYIRRMEEVKAEMSILAGTITAKVDKTKTGQTFGWTVTDSQWNVFNENGAILTVNSGGAYVKGEIQAGSGKIGGFNIGSDAIYHTISTYGSTASNTGVYLGTDGIQLGKKFLVDPYGNVSASALTVTGGSLSIGDDGQGNPMFQVTSAGYVTAKSLAIQGGSISIGGNFYVDSNGNLSANSGTFAGNVYAGNIKYEATTTGAGTVSGAALSLGTVTAGLSGSMPTGQLSLGACLSLGYADLFNMATQSGTSTYPTYFTAGSVYALSSIASRTFSVENSSGEELYHLNDHYHSFTEQNGKIIIGIPHNRTSIDDRSFNIADTQTYRDGVAAVTVASRAVLYCNATNYSDFDSGFDCDMTGSSYHYTTGGFTYGRLEVRNSTGEKIKDIRVKMPESSGQVTATVSITGAQVPAAADNATITATATLSNSGTASNTYSIYMETVTNTTSTVTMQVAHGSGSSKVILAQKSVTPTHPTVSITGTTGMTTSASNYTTYDRSVGLGSSSVYTSGSTQYGRVKITLSNGVEETLRVSMPAGSASVSSITVTRNNDPRTSSMNQSMQDWDLSDQTNAFIKVNLEAFSGSTSLGTDAGKVCVNDIAEFFASYQGSVLATNSSNYTQYDDQLTFYIQNYLYTNGNYKYARIQLKNSNNNNLDVLRVQLDADGSGSNLHHGAVLSTGSSNYTTYDTGYNWGSGLYNPSLSSGGSSVYGRLGLYDSSNILLATYRLAMSMSVTSASTSSDYSDYYYSGGHWYLKVHVKNSSNEIYQQGIDVQHAVDYGAQQGGGGPTNSVRLYCYSRTENSAGLVTCDFSVSSYNGLFWQQGYYYDFYYY